MEAILLALSLIERGAELVNKLRLQARQRGELTPEQDAELDRKISDCFKSDAWRTDDELDD